MSYFYVCILMGMGDMWFCHCCLAVQENCDVLRLRPFIRLKRIVQAMNYEYQVMHISMVRIHLHCMCVHSSLWCMSVSCLSAMIFLI